MGLLLAGASYLDLMVIFDLSHEPIFRSFKMLCGWIMARFKYPLVKALEEENVKYFEDISSSFAECGESNGVLRGGCTIGAVDGLLAIKVKRPTLLTGTLRDPGAYYCRKGFHALNCQGICDNNKKVQWISSRHPHIGSSHDDSLAFTSSTILYQRLLQPKKEFLYKNGYFLIGDSAYCMESFLLVPYDNPNMRTSRGGQLEDAYSYYHSNSRIKIECTFEEIIMRWGIFWRKMQMGIDSVGNIFSVAGLVHNFIIDERDGESMNK